MGPSGNCIAKVRVRFIWTIYNIDKYEQCNARTELWPEQFGAASSPMAWSAFLSSSILLLKIEISAFISCMISARLESKNSVDVPPASERLNRKRFRRASSMPRENT